MTRVWGDSSVLAGAQFDLASRRTAMGFRVEIALISSPEEVTTQSLTRS